MFRPRPSRSVCTKFVHAVDDEAVAFYLRYGFVQFPAGERTLFLPVETIAASLEI